MADGTGGRVRRTSRVWGLAVVLGALALLVSVRGAAASSPATAPFLAPGGCAMAHCDQSLSDLAAVDGPRAPVSALWHDTTVQGSGLGLGCSSNRTVAICSFTPTFSKKPTIRAYRGDGTVVYSSTLLNPNAYLSAPMVGPDGGAIVADNVKVARLSPSGSVLWQTRNPGGTPTSPTITDSGAVVVATLNGPVSAFDAVSGALLTSLRLSDTLTIDGTPTAGFFDTINTAAVRGDRIYVVTQFRDSRGKARPFGRLYAIDLARSGGAGTLTPAWHVDFEPPSGASPLVMDVGGTPMIFFDGKGLVPGSTANDVRFFGVRDLGSTGEIAWSVRMQSQPQASAAQDPRGGLWVYAPFRSNLMRLDGATGATLQTINVDPLVNQSGVHGPSSALTISGPQARPVMTLSASPPLLGSSYILAIDLVPAQALWVQRVDENRHAGGVGYGQFPIVERADGRAVVVFTTSANGTWGLGSP